MFKGSFVALITPFRKGKIDERKIVDLVEWHISQKTDGLVPVGTTGESATLSHKEHVRVIELVVRAAKGRVPVVAGAGSNSTEEAIVLSKAARALKVDGILSVNPYYNRPTQEGLKAHFSAIAKAAQVPVVLYNIPSRTGVALTVDTMVRLAEKHKNIVGVKEATGTIDVASELIQRLGSRFMVISGDDNLTLPLMSVGASGVISVAANLVPRVVSDMCRFAAYGDWDHARELHLKLFPLVKALFCETNPAPIKAAMKIAGRIRNASLRLPLVPVTSYSKKRIQIAMKEFGL